MPAAPEGIIHFCVMPSGMNFSFSNELLHRFLFLLLINLTENDAESIMFT